MIHHNTIRTYTAALLGLFNDLEVQYKLSDDSIRTKSVPIKYSNREKSTMLDEATLEQLLSGNVNILPRCSLVFDGLQKNSARHTNKNVKINTVKNEETFDYSLNSVPYSFQFSLVIMCRGMNELTSFIEQIAPIFNPSVNIDVADAQNLNELTRIPINLTGFEWDSEEYDSLSGNIYTLNVGLNIEGNLHQPIREITKIKQYRIFLNQCNDGSRDTKTVIDWDETNGSSITHVDENNKKPLINAIVSQGVFGIGLNTVTAIYDDADERLGDNECNYTIVLGDEFVESHTQLGTTLTMIVKDDTPVSSIITVSFKVIDIDGNFDTLEKTFTIT